MPDDARLLELQWLTEFELGLRTDAGTHEGETPETRLLRYLLEKAYVQDGGRRPLGGFHRVAKHGPYSSRLYLTHAGAIRRAELGDLFKANRIKEPMGLVWDGRHFHRDARIALLDAAPTRPLAVAYLDLNDVRTFNAIDHDAGDDAIRRYLEIVAELTFERGDPYRLSGGADEVIILLPRLDLAAALEFTRSLLAALGRAVVHELTLRAAAGVLVAIDPAEAVDVLKKRADAEQLRAKDRSRGTDRRPSVLAWPDDHCEVIPGPGR